MQRINKEKYLISKCKALIMLKLLMKEMETKDKERQKRFKRKQKIQKKEPKPNKQFLKIFKTNNMIVHNKITPMTQNWL
jgi:hypothetical protein